MYTGGMELISHIIIALSSVAYASYACLQPSRRKLSVSYGLIALTVATGTYLIVLYPSHMVQSCITGLVYVAAMTVMTAVSHYRLAQQES